MYAVLHCDCDMFPRESDSQNRSLELKSHGGLLLCVVPDDDSVLRPFGIAASTNKGEVVGAPKQFSGADACVEVSRYLQLAWIRVKDAKAGVQADHEARGIAVEGG